MNTITDIILKAESTEGILTPSETLTLVKHARALDTQLTTARIEVNKVLATLDKNNWPYMHDYFTAFKHLLE